MTDTAEARAREIVTAIFAIRAEGTSESGYGPPYGPPWHIIDTSKAEPEVNWPGELLATIEDVSHVSEALLTHRSAVVAAALRAALKEKNDG